MDNLALASGLLRDKTLYLQKQTVTATSRTSQQQQQQRIYATQCMKITNNSCTPNRPSVPTWRWIGHIMRKPASNITPLAQTWHSIVKKEGDKNKAGKTHEKGTVQL